MTSRTHDLFAASFLLVAVSSINLEPVSIPTAMAAFSTCFLGGLAPDIDEPGSEFWQRLPAGSGSIVGKIVAPVFVSHRFLSHSLLGVFLFGKLLEWILLWSTSFLNVDIAVVWWAGMIGFVSHLFADSLTKEGIPLFWPLPMKFGFPPFKSLRIRTGGFLEKFIIFPLLLIACMFLVYYRYEHLREFFHQLH